MTLRYDPAAHELTWDGGVLYMRVKEGRLFAAIASAHERTVPYDQIFAALWPNPADEPEDSTGSMRVQLSYLRWRLADAGAPVSVETRYDIGLRCVGVVEVVQ